MFIIPIGRHKYIAGAWWQTTEEASGKPNILLQRARVSSNHLPQERYNAVFIGKRQYGLINTKSAKIPAHPSLASSLREAGNNDVIYKFCLSEARDLWCVIAIHDGLINADGDYVTASEVEANDRVNELTAIHDFEKAFTFEDIEDSFEYFNQNLVPHLKLRPLYKTPLKIQLLVLGVAGAVCLSGWKAYSFYAQKKAAERKALEFLEIQQSNEKKRAEIQQQIDQYFPPSWMEKPYPESLRSVCVEKMKALPINSEGWDFAGFVCNEGGYQVKWKHQVGASFMHLPLYSKLNVQEPKSPIPEMQTLDAKFEKRAVRDLADRDTAQSVISEWARLNEGTLEITWNEPEKKIIGKDDKFEGVEAVSPYRRAVWSLKLPTTAIPNLPVLVKDLPGMVLTEIKSDESVTFGGEVYVQASN